MFEEISVLMLTMNVPQPYTREDLFKEDWIKIAFRNNDMVVILTVFIFMVVNLFLIKTLWFVDVFILNMVHSVDLFFSTNDWFKCSAELLFGSMYLLVTRGESIFFTLIGGSGIVTLWIATFHQTDGEVPGFRWIFFHCLLICCLSFLAEWAPTTVVCLDVMKTVIWYLFKYPGKTLEDVLVAFAFMILLLVFSKEDYNTHYLAVSYALSFAWMFLKH